MQLHKTILGLLFTLLSLIAVNLSYAHSPQPETTNNNYTIFPAPRNMESFQLVTNKNASFTEQSLHNHWTLLFFGFTHCPRICPTTLAKMEHIDKQLNAKNPSLQYVLVTVDPDRDTVTVLDQYVNKFNPQFIGVTGKEVELQKLEKQLGAFAQRVPEANGDYSMEHSSSVLLINPEGKWVGVLPYAMTPIAIANAVEKVIKG